MEGQSLEQKKFSLASSDQASTIIELMKDCMDQNPIVADTEFKTLVNAITLEVQGTMLRRMTDLLNSLKKGKII